MIETRAVVLLLTAGLLSLAGAGRTDAAEGCGGKGSVLLGGEWQGVNRTGTRNGDTLLGTKFPDTLKGIGGDDYLYGLGSDDALLGGAGADALEGGDGDDCLEGGRGKDTLRGGSGADVYWFAPGSGEDTVEDYGKADGTLAFADSVPDLSFTLGRDDLRVEYGTADHLVVRGGAVTSGIGHVALQGVSYRLWIGQTTADVLQGGAGRDWLHAFAGDDTVYGNRGDDRLDGGSGDDALYGRRGADVVRGGAGDDRLFGGAGDDTLEGGPGRDELSGGLGSDTYVFGGDFGSDILYEFGHATDVDILEFTGIAPTDVLLWRSFGSVVVGAGWPYLLGPKVVLRDQGATATAGYNHDIERIRIEGRDYRFVVASEDDDYVYGTAANDLVFGDQPSTPFSSGGDDDLSGGGGHDVLWGQGGRDWLQGGTGDDILVGGQQVDSLAGGTGNDTYVYWCGDALPWASPYSWTVITESITETDSAGDIDTFELRAAIDELSLSPSGGDVVAGLCTNDRVRILGQLQGTGIERLAAGGWVVPVAPLLPLLQQGSTLEFSAPTAGPVYVREVNGGVVGDWVPIATVDP